MREPFVFRHFFDGLALGGAIAEWLLACWVLDWFGAQPPLALHLIAPVALGVLNRAAARRLEYEPFDGVFAGRTGAVALASAFGAILGMGTLVAAAGLWTGLGMVGALRVEAGVVAATDAAAFFGTGFHVFAGILLVGTAVAVAHGYQRGYRRLTVTELTVPLDGFPSAGLRLVQVSDLHLGPMADREALRAAIARIMALQPDVVCVTGDLVDSPAADLDAWMAEIAPLSAPHGVFAILGNHDRHAGSERVAAALARGTTWRLLRDEVATLEVDGARLHLLGLEDRPLAELTVALPSLVAGVPSGEPAILLAHRPEAFPAAAAAGVPLTLVGHTHGGQVAVPGLPQLNFARVLITRFDAGTFTCGRALMHVNRGLGTSGQRIRIAAPCEITVVTLVSRAAAAA